MPEGEEQDPGVPSAVAALRAAYPWLDQVTTVEQLQSWVAEGFFGDALIGLIRQTEQYQVKFQGIFRPDGTLRMTEAQFLGVQDSYRSVLRDFGIDVDQYTPAEFRSFFEQEIDANELQDRLRVYDTIRRGSADLKDAFYVYAGMRPTVDDLYRATVDSDFGDAMVQEFNQRVAASPLDYATWITRATEAGLNRVVEKLQELRRTGVVTQTAITQVQQLAPDFSRQMMDLLFHGGNPEGPHLNLNELMLSFEYALIGSAASQSGLDIPDRDRIEAIRQAGVDRAKALEAYSDFASQRNLLSGAVQRGGLGSGFSQEEFERAVFLQQAPARDLLQRALGFEESLGRAGGGAGFAQDRVGRVFQPGLRQPGR